ncbi:unnamed protein product [Brassicogethes aeneus]|uniref:DUF4371 domain-containing protein n=1 Tax=Brassicogethes aeneus TaxID=1431903 RepID=A0A9P0FQ21_BRAAE|nr:unnamed protein product [Brassicogethes aeneus]
MAQIIRYVLIEDAKCSVEGFLDFIQTNKKTGSGLADEITKKINNDGFSDCRGQAYDNGANMAGIYRRVQALILQQNEYAQFLPCSAHSLNLVGVHAALVNLEMVTFFGTLQHIFTYFSGSTQRWEALSNLKLTLNGHSDTRWSSKYHNCTDLNVWMQWFEEFKSNSKENDDSEDEQIDNVQQSDHDSVSAQEISDDKRLQSGVKEENSEISDFLGEFFSKNV